MVVKLAQFFLTVLSTSTMSLKRYFSFYTRKRARASGSASAESRAISDLKMAALPTGGGGAVGLRAALAGNKCFVRKSHQCILLACTNSTCMFLFFVFIISLFTRSWSQIGPSAGAAKSYVESAVNLNKQTSSHGAWYSLHAFLIKVSGPPGPNQFCAILYRCAISSTFYSPAIYLEPFSRCHKFCYLLCVDVNTYRRILRK